MSKKAVLFILAGCVVLCICVVVVIVAILVLLPSNKDKSKGSDNGTNNGSSSTSTITEVPYEVNTFLEQSDLDKITAQNFKINKGFVPPTIEGSYLVDNWTVKYDKTNTIEVGKSIANCTYIFSNQTKDGRIDVNYTCSDEQGTGTGGYISGKDTCFTVYINQQGTSGSCTFKAPIVISGCMVEKGIASWQYAGLMKSRTESAECDQALMPVGDLRTITIDDAYAEKTK